MNNSNIFNIINNLPKKDFSFFLEGNQRYYFTERDKIVAFRGGFIFAQFKSFENAFDTIIKVRNKPDKKNGESKALNFVSKSKFNSFKTYLESINQENRKFNSIKEIIDSLSTNLKTLINLGGSFKKNKLKITENTNGMFDFGLASLGLYRPIEFFSQELENDIKKGVLINPFKFQKLIDGIVMPDAVKKNIIKNKIIFTIEFNKTTYFLERRQKGATEVFNNFSKECFLKANNEGIAITYDLKNKNTVFNGKGSVKLNYASNNKKSYLIYDKLDDNAKYVDIFLPVNFIGSENPSIGLIAPYLITETLESIGINVRINALRVGSNSGDKVTTCISIPVKNYDENISNNFNKIFNILGLQNTAADFFAFFKVYISNIGINGIITEDYQMSFNSPFYNIQSYMNNMMERYKNWVQENPNSEFNNTKVVNKNFQFAIAQDYSFQGAATTDNILEKFHLIMYKFYYFIDFLTVELRSIKEVVNEVMFRFEENENFNKTFNLPRTKEEKKQLIKRYFNQILLQKYLVIEEFAYEDSPQQIIEKKRKFEEKTIELDEAINLL
jgi:hypothetical protein